ncbi:amino acid adenylation domain-containing protein, partial [Microbispora sp. NPDC046973]|uniref:non-ribosomal peptide synthetase n=1 Tax=Microbispora sp. NPDC046973 TaxID=3155022 RepID=UPI0033F58ED5
YSTALFEGSTIERLAGHLTRLLEAIAQDPNRHLSALPILTDVEHQQLTTWNATTQPIPGTSISGQITAHATTHPDAPAITCNDQHLTYAQLDARANQLAHHLHTLGVTHETIVALHLPRSTDMVIAMLAVWRAGGAYLPLDPDHPTTRLTHQLTDSNAALLLTTTSTTEGHTGSTTPDISVVVLDDAATQAALQQQPLSPPAVDTLASQAAYLIYTSGSTGRPKSAVITHHNLTHSIDAQRRRFTLTSSDTALQLTSFTFDVAASDIFTTLTAGAHLVIADSLTRRSPAHLQHLMQRQRISFTQGTPTLLRHLDTTTLPHLRVLITGGEPCPPDLATIWADGRHLINVYGPTETTICATFTTPTTTFTTTTPPPIGAPLPNTHLHVLDPHLKPVPIGVPGELYITGAGLARGYHHRPALTAERFIADPFTPHGGRLYRTGDLARWRPDGQLDFLGRTDHQIKIRGNRIEPAEIEHTLTTHPAITTALVIEREQRLVAYLVPADHDQGIPPVSELREHLRAALPDYMIPTAFVELTAFPLTPNGKIDRTALPTPDSSRRDLTSTYQAPTTPTEELLAGIWADLLNLDHVGVTDNFFDLGGHSLLATQAITRIRGVFNAEVSLAALFDHPTVGELAAVIDTGTASEAPPPIVPVSREQKLPLSFAQQRLWFLDQLDPGSAEYVISTPIH